MYVRAGEFNLLMDQRLFDAAQTGNLLVLDELIAEDPLILEKVSLGTISDTPLHIAALVGQLDFAKEIIRRKPEFAKELNKDGFSPIHMASANGHLEIVKELLMSQFGYSLCMIKDNGEGRTALHFTVIKGRIEVMNELLSASSDSVREVTARGETVLHLAVKNNQFEALKLLVEKNLGIDEVLNAKDRDGNSVLHLAISKRQHRTIELLLGSETVNKVDVNAKNAINLTAMDMYDISLQSSCDLNDIEIGEILRRAGALRSRDINNIVPGVPPAQLITQPSIHNAAIQPANQTNNPASTTKQPIIIRVGKFFKNFSEEMYREIQESPSETQSALMVVAVLIATVTYQGGINPPGGVWQDHQDQSILNTGSTKHLAGKAVMEYEKLCFILFMVFNTVGFFMSLIIISLLTSRFPLRSWLRLAVVSMATAFGCGFCFIASFNGSCTKILLLCLFIGAVISWKYWWIEKWVTFTSQNRRRNENLENLHPSFIQRISTFIVSRSRSTTPINTV